MQLDEISISSLPKTSGRSIKRLESLNIYTYFDLIHHFPHRYEDYSTIVNIADVQNQPLIEDQKDDDAFELISKGKFTIKGTIQSFNNTYTRRRFSLQKVVLEDESGTIELVWFNQVYLKNIFKPGTLVSISGGMKEKKGFKQFQPDEYEILNSFDDTTLHTGTIVPIYRQTRGISTKTIRDKIYFVLQTYKDLIKPSLPKDILKKSNLTADEHAYINIHFPHSVDELKQARNRIAFDELFVVQLTSQLIKHQWQKEVTPHMLNKEEANQHAVEFAKSLPFTLTDAQKRSVDEIIHDMTRGVPMNRLLQGDVGSGKTVVAASAAYAAYKAGHTTLIMAPTEILAKQHFEGLSAVFDHEKLSDKPTVALHSRSSKLTKAQAEEADIIVGTHALLTAKVNFGNVALVVVDEQHKFGVVQREKLRKKGLHPHLLSMTATPIPRTVTLTMYGELDVSIIDELPKGRKTITTYVVPPKKRDDAYEWIRKELTEHKTQAFIVCPLIDESEAESLKSVKAANVEHERLNTEVFPELSVGLLHGRQKIADKDKEMKKFADGKHEILVSTPVVEVGIDIPNATIIVIETAERFGLAQLHQLRGRVGRSDKQSYCLLFTEKRDGKTLDRLNMFAKTHDGFSLAEYDLQNRGGGTIFGTAQSGMGDFQIASITDAKLISSTQKAVQSFIDADYNTDDYPALKKRLEKYHVQHIARN